MWCIGPESEGFFFHKEEALYTPWEDAMSHTSAAVLSSGPSIQGKSSTDLWMNALSPAVAQLCPPPSQSPQWVGKTGLSGAKQTWLIALADQGRAAVFRYGWSWFFRCTSHSSRHKNMPWRRDGSRHSARLRAQATETKASLSHLSGKFHKTRMKGYLVMSPTA